MAPIPGILTAAVAFVLMPWALGASTATTEVGATIRVGGFPHAIALGGGVVWVSTGQGEVVRIDPETERVVARATTEGTGSEKPCDLAATAKAAWAVASARNRLYRIDARTNEVTWLTIPQPGCAAIGAGYLWITSDRKRLYRVDPKTSRISGRPVSLPRVPQGVAVAGDSVWVSSGFGRNGPELEPPFAGTLVRVDARRLSVRQVVRVERFPEHVAFGSGGLWVTSNDGTVVRIDPRTGRVLRRVRVADGGRTRIAVGGGAVWATVVLGPGPRGVVVRLDVEKRRVRRSEIAVGESPVGLAIGAGAVWAANFNSGTVSRIDAR